MQIKRGIAFAVPKKRRLFDPLPFGPAAAPPTSVTSLQIIKDVIKHHQSQARSQRWTRMRGPPSTFEARERRRGLRLSLQTQEPKRPVSSRQVKGRINRSGSGGRVLGLPGGPLRRVEAGCCFLSWKLERWHNEVLQRGPVLFLCSRHAEQGAIRRWHRSSVVCAPALAPRSAYVAASVFSMHPVLVEDEK